MPYIARTVEQRKMNDGLRIIVRVTGVGSKDGSKLSRAKARALYESGFLPWYSTETRQFNVLEGSRERRFSEEVAVGFDEQMDKGDIGDVRERIKVARKEAGVFAQLSKIREIDTSKEVDTTKIEEVFGPGFFNIVSTHDYHFLISTKTSLG